MQKLKQLSLYIFLGLLAYIPFHIFFSTWIGSSLGVLGFAKGAKDGAMLVGFLFVLIVSFSRAWFRKLARSTLVWLIVLFILLSLVLSLIKPTDPDAEIVGFVYNTRFLVFFLYGLLLAHLYDPKWLMKRSLKIVLITASFVLFLGIVQYTVLPDDALEHVGYARGNGVLPAFFIDDKPDLERVMSTLRDPNSLGSYIIIIGSVALAVLFRGRLNKQRKAAAWLLLLSFVGLYLTFSRSAWLGFGLATLTVIGFSIQRTTLSRKTQRHILMGVISSILLGVIGLIGLRSSYFVQNVIFHADESTVLENPNELRARFWQESTKKILDEPLGHGPGTAGLASIRNEQQGVHLNENYYLQLGHELGILGLLTFLGIVGIVGLRLYGLASSNLWALALFASFVGLALTNFLVHIWANEAVAYTWWGLAGIGLVTRSNKKTTQRA